MNKLLFFDIDGTLAMPGKAPGKDTVQAIRAARANGHRVFLSTGRPEYSIPEEINGIGFDGGIYFGGGRVVIHGETVYDQPIDRGLSRLVTEILLSYSLSFNLECAFHNYRYSAPQADLPLADMSDAGSELQRIRLMDQNDPHGRLFQKYDGEPVYKISFRSPSRKQFEAVRNRLSGTAKTVCFENLKPGFPLLFCEVSDPEINKGQALELVCHSFHMHTDQSIAFGDSMNDAEILRAAGLGIAMGNAEDRLKALADKICESCEENGVARELARLGLAI